MCRGPPEGPRAASSWGEAGSLAAGRRAAWPGRGLRLPRSTDSYASMWSWHGPGRTSRRCGCAAVCTPCSPPARQSPPTPAHAGLHVRRDLRDHGLCAESHQVTGSVTTSQCLETGPQAARRAPRAHAGLRAHAHAGQSSRAHRSLSCATLAPRETQSLASKRPI